MLNHFGLYFLHIFSWWMVIPIRPFLCFVPLWSSSLCVCMLGPFSIWEGGWEESNPVRLGISIRPTCKGQWDRGLQLWGLRSGPSIWKVSAEYFTTCPRVLEYLLEYVLHHCGGLVLVFRFRINPPSCKGNLGCSRFLLSPKLCLSKASHWVAGP